MDKTDIEILLVEDNPGDADYLIELLSDERDPAFSILHVQRLSDALAEIRRRSFHVVLLDLGLPDSQGIDTLLIVRKESPLPIIVLTGLADETFALEAIKMGADDYLTKGQINPVLVTRTIRYALERRHAEEVLRESSQRLRQAIQAGRMIAWSWDAGARKLTVSDNFEEIYGRTAVTSSDEALALVHPEDREKHRSVVIDAIQTSDAYRSEFRIIRPDTGAVVWLEERGRVQKNSNGRVTRITGLAIDITERKRAEERIAHLASFPESHPSQIIETDLSGKITYVNPAARQRFSDILQRGIDHPLLTHWKSVVQSMQERNRRATSVETEISGAWFDQLFSFSPDMSRVRIYSYDITERKRAEQAVRESEERYRVIMESARDAIFTIDGESRIVLANPAAERTFGYSTREMEGKSLTMLMPERLRKPHREAVQRLAAGGKRQVPWSSIELPGLHRDGREIPLEISYGDFFREGKRFFIGIVRDVSERKKTEEKIRRSDAILKQAGQMANLGAWEIDIENQKDLNANPLLWSEQVYRIFGYEPGSVEVSNRFFFGRVHPEDRDKIMTAVTKAIELRKPYSIEHRIIRPDGEERIVYEHAEISYDDQGRPVRIVGAVQDITERRKAEEMIRYQSYHDLLTGLPNRAELMVKLGLEIAQAARNNTRLAVVHLDLDRFKVINDTLGHAIGDRVILAVAERLGGIIRQSDTLSRVGSDEFIILLADLKTPEDAARVAVQIVTGMRRLFSIDNKELYVTASIGISMFPEDSRDPEVLLSNADIAVSHVKETGRNNYQFFNRSINIRTLERLLLESNLRQTIERSQLELYYQPQVDIRTGEIICLEALVRWNHPDLGLLLPAQFIPIAEEIGFITSIDEWVLRTACAQNKAWQDAGAKRMCVTVNISSQQFQHPELIKMVRSTVGHSGLDPSYLDIEVTESTAMRDIDLAIPNLRGLNSLGINLSIDDFGTGYSSLNYLKRFPVQTLKIDQSFIRGVATDLDDQAIVKAVIAMGHNLRLKVLAEGVETREQLSFLRDSDCDEMQGFLFSEPLPAPQIRGKFS